MGEYDSKVVSFQQESGFVHQRALMNWRAGNYPDALNLIRKAVESDPTDARCRLDMARILVSMELYEAAGRQLMWLLSEARELEECLFLSGKILYARGRQEEAENVLRAYVDHSGGHESVEEAERMLDRIYLNSEIQEEMAEDRRERRVQKLIEEGIRQLEALGDSRSSEQAFGHAVRLNPLRVSAHALYAVVLNLNGKPEDARREAIMAGRLLGPSAALPDVCICAQALYESGMREEGHELMSRAREMDADDEGKRVRVTALNGWKCTTKPAKRRASWWPRIRTIRRCFTKCRVWRFLRGSPRRRWRMGGSAFTGRIRLIRRRRCCFRSWRRVRLRRRTVRFAMRHATRGFRPFRRFIWARCRAS